MWYQRLLKKSPPKNIIPLSSLKKGEEGFIYGYRQLTIDGISHLQNLGLGRGTPFVILQTYPCYLLKSGEERIAFDQELASCIQVVPTGRKE